MLFAIEGNITAVKPGAAAHKAAQNSIDKYKYIELTSTYLFYAIAIETTGTRHGMVIEVTQ